VIDANENNLATARAFVERGDDERRRAITFRHERFSIERATEVDTDLLVIPLAYQGDREAVYAQPPARTVVVHDWLWCPRGRSRIVSVFLLKRLNLVTR
jgi:hypothetical protein